MVLEIMLRAQFFLHDELLILTPETSKTERKRERVRQIGGGRENPDIWTEQFNSSCIKKDINNAERQSSTGIAHPALGFIL